MLMLILWQRLEDLEYDREKRSVRGPGASDRPHRREHHQHSGGSREHRRSSNHHHNYTKVSTVDTDAHGLSQSAIVQPVSNRPDGLAITVRQGTPSRSVTQEGKNRLAALLGKGSSGGR